MSKDVSKILLTKKTSQLCEGMLRYKRCMYYIPPCLISSFDGSSIYFGWKSTRVKSLSEMESCLSIDGNIVDVTRPAARVSRQMGKSLVERGKHYHFVSLPLI